MSEYSDTWDLLNQPAAPAPDLSVKGRSLAFIQANADSAQLTPNERYQLAWGEDATTEDWVKQKAEAIRKELDASASIAVLRNGAPARVREAAGTAPGAAGAAGAAAANGASSGQGGSNDGNGDGQTGPNGDGSNGSLGGLGSSSKAGLNASNSVAGTGLNKGLMAAVSAVSPVLGIAMKAYDAYDRSPTYNGYGTLDGTTTPATGPGTIGSRDTHGSNESAPGPGPGADANTNPSSVDAVNGSDSQSDNAGPGPGPDSTTDAASASATNGSDSQSDSASSSGGGDSQSDSASSSGGGGSSSDTSGDGTGGEANGGLITAKRLRGPNPPGPDDGYTALDIGEYVVRASSVKHYGADVMAALNAGRLPVAAVRKLLNL